MLKQFADLGVARKMMVGFGLVAALFLFVIAYGVGSLIRVQEAEDALVRITDGRKAARGLDVEFLRIIVALQYFINTPDPALLAEIAESRRAVDSIRQRIRTLDDSANLRAALDAYERGLPARRTIADALIAAVRGGAPPETVASLQATRRALDDTARTYLRQIIDLKEEASLQQQRLTRAMSRNARNNMIIVSGAAFVLMVTFAILLTRSITRPIRQLQQMTERMGQGDFSIKNDIDTEDEIGAFARTLNTMAADVARLDEARRTSSSVSPRTTVFRAIQRSWRCTQLRGSTHCCGAWV